MEENDLCATQPFPHVSKTLTDPCTVVNCQGPLPVPLFMQVMMTQQRGSQVTAVYSQGTYVLEFLYSRALHQNMQRSHASQVPAAI